MQRRVVFLLAGLLLILPSLAKASTLSAQGNVNNIDLLGNTPGQTVTLMISGDDFYNIVDLRMVINGGVGPAPAVETVFNHSASNAIPGANLAGSIWFGHSAGIHSFPNGTTATSSGLETTATFGTAGGTSHNAAGILAVYTLTTVGVPLGVYSVDLGGTVILNGIDPETFEEIFVEYDVIPFTLTVVPEPSSIVMGLFAAAGLAAVVIRRRRNA